MNNNKTYKYIYTYIYIYIYTRTYVHTNIHTHIHALFAYIHACIRAYKRTHVHTCIHAYRQAHITRTRMHTLTYAYTWPMHIPIPMHTHKHMHIHTLVHLHLHVHLSLYRAICIYIRILIHVHTCTYICTYIYIYIYIYIHIYTSIPTSMEPSTCRGGQWTLESRYTVSQRHASTRRTPRIHKDLRELTSFRKARGECGGTHNEPRARTRRYADQHRFVRIRIHTNHSDQLEASQDFAKTCKRVRFHMSTGNIHKHRWTTGSWSKGKLFLQMATGDNDRAGGRLTFSLDAPLPPDCARGAHAQTCEARGPCGEGLQRLLHSFRRLVNQERPSSKPWGDKDHEDTGWHVRTTVRPVKLQAISKVSCTVRPRSYTSLVQVQFFRNPSPDSRPERVQGPWCGRHGFPQAYRL